MTTTSARLASLLCVLGASSALATWDVVLSAEEKAWVEQHPVVKIAHPADYGPFSFVDERGQLVGLNLDYLQVISAKTGLRFENVMTRGLNEAFERIERGEVDAVMAIGKQKARERFMLFTVAFAYSPDAIVTRTDAPFLFDVRGLNGQRIGVAASSSSLLVSLEELTPDSTVVRFDTMTEAVRAVSKGEVFAAVTDASIAAFTVKQERLTNLRVGGVFAHGDTHIGVRRDAPELVSIFDKVIITMPAAEKTQIVNRWMVLDYESDRRWQRASSVLAAVLAIGAVVFVIAVFNARRRTKELATRRQMQRELEAAHEALEQTNRGKSGLMRMIAHDLRNPLATLSLNVDALDHPGELPASEHQEVVDEMRAAVARMVGLIDALVDLQAIEEGKRRYRAEPVVLGTIAREAASAMSETAAAKSISIDVQATELSPLQSDPAALRQVIDNLLSNALKYSPRGTRVSLEVSGTSEHQRVVVRDQGPGISEADRAKLFQKYGRGAATPTGGETSTGLGLWIVQQIANGLRGQVRCESEPGRGAAFIFEVPSRS